MSKPDVAGPVIATSLGAIGGGMAVSSAGYTAAGMVGGGAGIGAAAGPVGMAIGALAGMSAYGLAHAIAGEPEARLVLTEEVFAQIFRLWRKCPSCSIGNRYFPMEPGWEAMLFPEVWYCDNRECDRYNDEEDDRTCVICGGRIFPYNDGDWLHFDDKRDTHTPRPAEPDIPECMENHEEFLKRVQEHWGETA